MTLWQVAASIAATISGMVAVALLLLRATRIHAREQVLEMLLDCVTRADLQQFKTEVMEELRYVRQRLDVALNSSGRNTRG